MAVAEARATESAPDDVGGVLDDVAREIRYLHINGNDEVRERERLAAQVACLPAACDAGDAHACYLAGEVREHDLGTMTGERDAAGYYEVACTQGVTDACVSLADLRDDAETLSQLCRDGAAGGCEVLAAQEWSQPGSDMAESMRLRTRACTLGDGSACAQLGYHYLWETDSESHVDLALPYLRLACHQDAWRACHALWRIFSSREDEAASRYFWGRLRASTTAWDPASEPHP